MDGDESGAQEVRAEDLDAHMQAMIGWAEQVNARRLKHTAYTTSMESSSSRLSLATISGSTMDHSVSVKRRDKPRRRRQGNKRNQNRDRSSKKERKGKKGRKRIRTCNCKLHHLVLWYHCRA